MTPVFSRIFAIALSAISIANIATLANAETLDELRARFTATNAAEVAAFREADRQVIVKPGNIIFTGSSSIKRWNLEKSFPGKEYINRGFGGSTI
ncbi:MAG: hypothetical protein GTO41_18250, partial [Burkholderiales bacterium]|nr:hypothetical protein [Burkholderiales bacterium]